MTRGFGVIEAIIGSMLIVTSTLTIGSIFLYSHRAVLDIEARAEWNMMNFQISSVLGDSLLCAKLGLVRQGDPQQIVARPTLVSVRGDLIASPSSIEFYFDPSDPTRRITIASVGSGHSFELVSISISQLIPPADQYSLHPPAPAGTTRAAIPLEAILRGRYRSRLLSGRITYEHRFSADINTTIPGGPLYAIGCYAGQSRQRVCEQLGMVYDPVGSLSYNHFPAGSSPTRSMCQYSGPTLPLSGP